MDRLRTLSSGTRKAHAAEREFTVVLVPLFNSDASAESAAKSKTKRKGSASLRFANAPKPTGYQVTVPSLPGLITYGRTQTEAWTMAQDAIRCHIEGLQKDGEPIPDERDTQFRKLRISA